MFYYSIPFLIAVFIITFIFSEKLAAPLRNLAFYTMNPAVYEKSSETKLWYFEVDQLSKILDSYLRNQELASNV